VMECINNNFFIIRDKVLKIEVKLAEYLMTLGKNMN